MRLRTDPWLRTFLIIFSGQAFSLLGSAAVNFALVWWLTAETGSARILSWASIAAILPQALLGPFTGPFIDRWDRRLTMIGADLLIAATSVVLIVMFLVGSPAVGILIAIIGLRSVGAAFHTPASQAAVPMYVPTEHLMRVAGWNFFLASGVAMAGPVIGALLMGIAPVSLVAVVDVTGALFAVVSLLVVRIPHPQAAEGVGRASGLLAEFVEGWRELVRQRGLRDLTLVLAVVTLLYMPLNALFPLMTFAHFGGDAVAASTAEVAFGAGMLIGSLAVGFLASRFSGVQLVVGGIVLIGTMIGLSGLLPSSAFWVFAGLCVVMGLSVPLFGSPLTALFQTLIDPAKLGRVLSLYTTVALLMAPFGLLLAGPLAERLGVAVWFAVSGALLLVTGLLLRAMPAVRALDQAVVATLASSTEATVPPQAQ